MRGHVVLVNFWTLTCINWLRIEPWVRAWSQAYRGDGLVIVGVHAPEFSFEHEVDNVRRSIVERGIEYPVVLDNDLKIWRAFDNHYWPALYFVDPEGVIRDEYFGEGRYDESEAVIQNLLGIDREPVSVVGSGVEAPADWDHLGSPETYLDSIAKTALYRPKTKPKRVKASTDFQNNYDPISGGCREAGRSKRRRSCCTKVAGALPCGSTRRHSSRALERVTRTHSPSG